MARERSFEVPSDLVFRPGMGLDDALSRFAFTLSLLERPEAASSRRSRIIAVNAPQEYAHARAKPGMTDELYEKAIAFGHAAAFRR